MKRVRELLTFQDKRNLLLAAWVIAALATVLVEIPLLLAFPMFPLGLFIAFEIGPARSGPFASMGFVCALGWLLYLVVTCAALFTRDGFSLFCFTASYVCYSSLMCEVAIT